MFTIMVIYIDAFKGYDLDNDDFISRDELFRMFKAYFYLSMELVRDVVSAMEDDMMDNFEFSASQPVSAAFTVAIPSTSSDEEDNTSQNGGATSGNDEHRVRDDSRNRASRRLNTRKEDYFQQQYAEEGIPQHTTHDRPEVTSSSSSESSILEDPEPMNSPTDISESHWLPPHDEPPTFSSSGQKEKQLVSVEEREPKKPWEEKFPIMETMSRDAIEEMVEKTFRSIDTKREGYISYEEFKQFVQTDSSIVSWFEALGTVF
jgi:EF hand